MTQDNHDPAPPAPEPPAADTAAAPRPGDAWRDVLVQIDALGEAVGEWTKATINDPDNRRQAAEIGAKLETVANKVATSFDEASKTEVGSAVVGTAEKTGRAVVDAGEKVAEAAAPHVASALSGLAGVLGKAAERVGRAAERPSGAAGESPEPQAPDAPSGSELSDSGQ